MQLIQQVPKIASSLMSVLKRPLHYSGLFIRNLFSFYSSNFKKDKSQYTDNYAIVKARLSQNNAVDEAKNDVILKSKNNAVNKTKAELKIMVDSIKNKAQKMSANPFFSDVGVGFNAAEVRKNAENHIARLKSENFFDKQRRIGIRLEDKEDKVEVINSHRSRAVDTISRIPYYEENTSFILKLNNAMFNLPSPTKILSEVLTTPVATMLECSSRAAQFAKDDTTFNKINSICKFTL